MIAASKGGYVVKPIYASDNIRPEPLKSAAKAASRSAKG
jgi:hypothetical protein